MSGSENLKTGGAWRGMDTAPKNATWVELNVIGRPEPAVAHWASDLSGSDQPAFQGWFESAGTYYSAIPDNQILAWRPVSDAQAAAAKVGPTLW